MLLSSCAACVKKKLTFRIKKLRNFNDYFKMNKIVNKYLLTGDKFIPKLRLKQPRFNYSACGSLSKFRGRIQKFRETDSLK